MGRLLATAATALLSASAVFAQTGNGIKCSANQKCPDSTPCCSRKPRFLFSPRASFMLTITQNTVNVALEHTA